MGKCDNKRKEGFLCVKRTLRAGAKNALSANATRYAELLTLESGVRDRPVDRPATYQ